MISTSPRLPRTAALITSAVLLAVASAAAAAPARTATWYFQAKSCELLPVAVIGEGSQPVGPFLSQAAKDPAGKAANCGHTQAQSLMNEAIQRAVPTTSQSFAIQYPSAAGKPVRLARGNVVITLTHVAGMGVGDPPVGGGEVLSDVYVSLTTSRGKAALPVQQVTASVSPTAPGTGTVSVALPAALVGATVTAVTVGVFDRGTWLNVSLAYQGASSLSVPVA